MIMLSRSLLGFRLASRGSMYRTSVYQLKSSVSSTTFTSSALRNNYEQLTSLLQEINNIVRSPGMAKVGFTRSFQVSKALAKVAIEFTKNREVYMDSKGQLSLPKSLRRIFEELGSTYIKLGQFIASSPTLFPPEYVTEFQACLDKSPSVPYSVIRKTIQDDLKRPISSVFGSIDPKPLATASIAQVHKAKLRDGTDVVIKVQKPGVDSMLQADLSFLLIATKILEFINPAISSFSLVNIVGDLRDSMLDELDFTKEASNLENFRTFLKVNNIVDATAPMHYPSASGKKVLTMEYLKGVPLVDLEGIKKYTSSPENTLVSALRTWATSVANNDVFHADVHAGNLLVLEDGRIGFIDFGIGRLHVLKNFKHSLVNSKIVHLQLENSLHLSSKLWSLW